ncbi:YnbE family lipoprotein [Novosphingobium sp. B 225]|uniref:YnbE family lipoprotein n=1 Tax=Novosphingobium sp. B 225 TaxID=1961849 RepID=UPI0020CE6C47|nr:YnbE family lipoprotein [Novosphingobium sp. B 225]
MIPQLTNRALLATTGPMDRYTTGKRWPTWQSVSALGMVMGGALALGGCISVNAPDKPIVIELNINIKQEVVYRLAADADKTIDENSGIF